MWRIMGLFAIREGFRLTVMSAKRALILRRMPGGVMGILGLSAVYETAKYLRKPMEYAYYLDKLVDILAQPAKEYNLSSPNRMPRIWECDFDTEICLSGKPG